MGNRSLPLPESLRCFCTKDSALHSSLDTFLSHLVLSGDITTLGKLCPAFPRTLVRGGPGPSVHPVEDVKPGVAITSWSSVLSTEWTARCMGRGTSSLTSPVSSGLSTVPVSAQNTVRASKWHFINIKILEHEEKRGVVCNSTSLSLMIQLGARGDKGPAPATTVTGQAGSVPPPALGPAHPVFPCSRAHRTFFHIPNRETRFHTSAEVSGRMTHRVTYVPAIEICPRTA